MRARSWARCLRPRELKEVGHECSDQTAAEFEEIENLLPWHAAGTLDPADAARVEAALADDRELAARFELVREELGETVALNETLGAPSGRARERLFALIEQEPARKVAGPGLVSRFTAFMTGLQPRTLAYGAGAAALALVLQAGLLAGFMLNGQQPGSHQLASAPVAAPAEQGAHVLIRFNPQASIADITGFLDQHRAAVVDGPAAGGMFRVRVSDKRMEPGEFTALVKTISQSPLVGLALPAGH